MEKSNLRAFADVLPPALLKAKVIELQEATRVFIQLWGDLHANRIPQPEHVQFLHDYATSLCAQKMTMEFKLSQLAKEGLLKVESDAE